ncbi:MAG: hypothetical protein LBU04_04615 [Christensenellaceae bacterium]|jgi:hypothetical protein|nr:hypothetical protein [Christensenellaceae bacterium]
MESEKFNEMIAYEFSNLTTQEGESVSQVTILDCKHCNDGSPIKEKISVENPVKISA